MKEVRLIDANILKEKLIMNFSRKPEAQAIYQHLIDIVDDCRTVEQPQGEWEENENGTGNCNKCQLGIYYRTPTGRVFAMTKEQIIKFGYKYCPNCGAKMT